MARRTSTQDRDPTVKDLEQLRTRIREVSRRIADDDRLTYPVLREIMSLLEEIVEIQAKILAGSQENKRS